MNQNWPEIVFPLSYQALLSGLFQLSRRSLDVVGVTLPLRTATVPWPWCLSAVQHLCTLGPSQEGPRGVWRRCRLPSRRKAEIIIVMMSLWTATVPWLNLFSSVQHLHKIGPRQESLRGGGVIGRRYCSSSWVSEIIMVIVDGSVAALS